MPTIGVRAGAIRGRAWVCAGLLGLLLTSCDDPVAALIGVTAVSTGPRRRLLGRGTHTVARSPLPICRIQRRETAAMSRPRRWGIRTTSSCRRAT